LIAAALPVWSVVSVPFPYVDHDVRKARPALVISSRDFQTATGLCWLLMITSAAHDRWPGDIPITDMVAAGLSKPSIVRTAKVAVAEVRRLLPIGALPEDQRNQVVTAVSDSLGWSRPAEAADDL
jgi:mRNA-degrading endonuclease toxin of MazEF toxin-antitoxin module